jgi:hypothetical protein
VHTLHVVCYTLTYVHCFIICVLPYRSIKTLNDGVVENAAGTADTGSWESTGIIDCADVFDAP